MMPLVAYPWFSSLLLRFLVVSVFQLEQNLVNCVVGNMYSVTGVYRFLQVHRVRAGFFVFQLDYFFPFIGNFPSWSSNAKSNVRDFSCCFVLCVKLLESSWCNLKMFRRHL